MSQRSHPIKRPFSPRQSIVKSMHPGQDVPIVTALANCDLFRTVSHTEKQYRSSHPGKRCDRSFPVYHSCMQYKLLLVRFAFNPYY